MTPRRSLVWIAAALLGSASLSFAEGSLDRVTAGYALGWAQDPARPRAPLSVHFYAGGPAGQGRLLGSVRTSLARPDVARATGRPGSPGFRYRLPTSYRAGQALYAYAILPGQPELIGRIAGAGTPPPAAAPTPAPSPSPTPSLPSATGVGRLERVGGGVVHGWALDPQAPGVSIDVHLYSGGPAGSGRLLGSVRTDVLRRDVNQVHRVSGRHGFRFSLPAGLRQRGTIYAYAILVGAAPALLEGSPLSYGAGAPAPAPARPATPGQPGAVDGVDGRGILRGWSSADEVEVSIDGRTQGSVETLIPVAGRGAEGFAFAIPNGFRDGRAHRIEAFALTSSGRTSLGTASFTLPRPGGSLTLRGSLLTVETSARYGGAVTAIHVRGRQIVNNTDHGRQVQVAWNYGEGERRMPTEAGNNRDQGISTSVALAGRVEGKALLTEALPAYWGKPGTQVFQGGVGSGMGPTRNKSEVTPDLLQKRVEVDHLGDPHLMRWRISVTPQASERELLIEIPAIYLQRSQFTHFLHLDPQTGATSATLPARNRRRAMILMTADQSLAVGLYSPDANAYGSWDFGADQKTTKINATVHRRTPLRAGQRQTFTSYVAVGSVVEVVRALRRARQQH